MHFRTILIFFLLLALAACRKESDQQSPVIELNSPVENTQFNAFDEILVTGTVYDNERLADIRIQLLDNNLTPALPAVQLTSEGNSYTLNHAYALDDLHLETGPHYLLVQASDGIQATNKYVKLYINQAPKELKYLLVVTRSGNTLHVLKADSAMQISTLFDIQSDYMGSAVSSDHQQFYIGGRATGDFLVYDMNEWQPAWEVPVTINPPFPWFSGMKVSGGFSWIGYRNGYYEKYNPYGTQLTSVNTQSTWSPLKFCLAGDKLITEEKSYTGPERMISLYYESTGTPAGDHYFNGSVVEMVALDDDDVCILVNDGAGQGHLHLFNSTVMDSWEPPSTFTAGKVLCALAYGEDVLIGHEDGLYGLRSANLSLIQIEMGMYVNAVACDEVNNFIFAAEHKTLNIFLNFWPALPYLMDAGSIAFNDTILAIHPVYNKD